jgi:hypothetical protein
VDITRLTAEVASFRFHSESIQHQLAIHKEKFNGFNKSKTDIAAVEQLRTDMTALKDWTGWFDSLIVRQFPLF